LYDLARAIGYRTLPLEEAKALVKELEGRHGRKAVAEAAKAIVAVDATTQPPTVRLTDEALRLCWQLLGPPPDGRRSPATSPGGSAGGPG
jgi:hypothetical protein